MRFESRLVVAMGFALLPDLGSAHHPLEGSFDKERQVTLLGNIRSLEWANPHVIFGLEVGSGAQARLWLLQLDPPGYLKRRGYTPVQLAAGSCITVLAHPSRDGAPAGVARSICLGDGTLIEATTDGSWNWRSADVPAKEQR